MQFITVRGKKMKVSYKDIYHTGTRSVDRLHFACTKFTRAPAV